MSSCSAGWEGLIILLGVRQRRKRSSILDDHDPTIVAHADPAVLTSAVPARRPAELFPPRRLVRERDRRRVLVLHGRIADGRLLVELLRADARVWGANFTCEAPAERIVFHDELRVGQSRADVF